MFRIASRREGKLQIISLSGKVDDGACKGLAEALEAGCRSFNEHVLLDLQDLAAINRSRQRIILKYLSELHRSGWHLIVCQPRQAVQYAFYETGMDRVMTILPTLQEAKTFVLSRRKY